MASAPPPRTPPRSPNPRGGGSTPRSGGLRIDYENRLWSPHRTKSATRRSTTPRGGSVAFGADGSVAGAGAPPRPPSASRRHGDRFIPNRGSSLLESGFDLIDDATRRASLEASSDGDAAGADGSGSGDREPPSTHSLILRNELLGADVLSPAKPPRSTRRPGADEAKTGALADDSDVEMAAGLGLDAELAAADGLLESDDGAGGGAAVGGGIGSGAGAGAGAGAGVGAGAGSASPSRNLFRFSADSPGRRHSGGGGGAASGGGDSGGASSIGRTGMIDPSRAFSLSPLGPASERLLASPRKPRRKVAKVPFKVLDAPALQDDYYLHLVDWSAQNVLAVGLGPAVYLWSACTSKVTRLVDLGHDDRVTSVAWTQRGTHLAVGTQAGKVQVWEAARCKLVRTMTGHNARVGSMSWNSHSLATGSRDRHIFLRDVREPEHHYAKLEGHRQEVCGLKWSFDNTSLASGGNDNKLLIWDAATQSQRLRFAAHTAAVKAIAWSPHQHGLLASGGGTADRTIRFWNTNTPSGTALGCVDTGSQVCNIAWSKSVNEIVSTHGYSLNQIIVWKYPSMRKVATLTGHTYRVLYLSMSPDGQTVVTGAGDETLRFWNVFPEQKNKGGSGSLSGRTGSSLLFPGGTDIR